MTNKPETIIAEDPWAKSEWLSAELDRVRQRCVDLEDALTASGLIIHAVSKVLGRVRDRGKIADAPEIVFGQATARLIERDYGSFRVSRDVAYIAAFASSGDKGVAALDAIERVIGLAP